ncbi:MAG: NAD(P)/FAD-dependent oxidoreductase [Victivallaceae bacterium]|nr:NAD(P)/FAD-dependent oxidoreductase [Victivallaceae bacterium]
MNCYDVAIVGAGVSGASVAWQLSKYKLKVALLEKEADVGFGVSKANSGIVHGGFHHSAAKTLKAKLEVRGNLMFESLQYQLGFPFRRNGILVVGYSEEEMETVRMLYRQGKANGVRNLELCGRDRVLQLEPKLSQDVAGGFFAPNGGTIEPYRYVFALVEGAKRGGVELLTGFKLSKAVNRDGRWELESADGRRIAARYAVNAAGLYADDVSRIFNAEQFRITPRKGEEYLLDRHTKAAVTRVVFPVPTKVSKGILVIPTVEGTVMIGPTAEATDDKSAVTTSSGNLQRILAQVKHMVDGISAGDVITSFAGMRPTLPGDDFMIEPSAAAPNLIQVAGIQSPGLTASPAIGEYVKDLLKNCGLELVEKAEPEPYVPPVDEIRRRTPEELDALCKKDPAYGRVVCRCEQVSEAEIVEAIRQGHTTIDGIKFYTRSGMGRCQGGFCTERIIKILCRETGMRPEDITKRGGDSRIIAGRLK